MTQTATAPASVITPEIVAEHGLSPEEARAPWRLSRLPVTSASLYPSSHRV